MHASGPIEGKMPSVRGTTPGPGGSARAGGQRRGRGTTPGPGGSAGAKRDAPDAGVEARMREPVLTKPRPVP